MRLQRSTPANSRCVWWRLHCRALSQVHPAGGLVPRLLLLVQRVYPLQFYCHSTRQFVSAKALAQAQRQMERQQEQVGGGLPANL
jgi:hypothetical protein